MCCLHISCIGSHTHISLQWLHVYVLLGLLSQPSLIGKQCDVGICHYIIAQMHLINHFVKIGHLEPG